MTPSSVLVSDCDLPGSPVEDALRGAGLTVSRAADTSFDTLVAAGRTAEGLVVQWTPVSGALMDAMPALRIISRLGIGYDMIDVEAATARGIAVANTPGYCVEEVAAHTIAMIMAHVRGLVDYDRAVRAGRWTAVGARPLAARPSRATVGVLGFGRIGSLVARGMRGLGFRVLVADPYASVDAVRAAGCEPVPIDEAVEGADVLTLHVPLTAQTHHLIDATRLASMREGAVIVNTCRGALVDEGALADALETGRIGAAALDVFATEPLPESSPLRARDDVLLSPHAAWYSPDALVDLPVHAADNVVRFLGGVSGAAVVNPDYVQNIGRGA